jgi:hypothetical protein
MKISELLNEITRPKTQMDADQVLRDAGYTRIANGAFGAVYQKNNKTVIKTFTAFDSAYLSFIKMVKSSNNNPHFPKFYGNPIKITDLYYAIKQENLQEYRGNYVPIRRYIEYLISRTKIGYNSDFEEVEEIIHDYPRFDEACKMIAELVKSNSNINLDIHQFNIMKRGRTLVFIDPISTPIYNDDERRQLPKVDRWDTRVKQKPQKEKPFVMTPEFEEIFAELEKEGMV